MGNGGRRVRGLNCWPYPSRHERRHRSGFRPSFSPTNMDDVIPTPKLDSSDVYLTHGQRSRLLRDTKQPSGHQNQTLFLTPAVCPYPELYSTCALLLLPLCSYPRPDPVWYQSTPRLVMSSIILYPAPCSRLPGPEPDQSVRPDQEQYAPPPGSHPHIFVHSRARPPWEQPIR